MAGSGKTTTVCQSVRQATKKGSFKSNGCYWMKIGNISNTELCQKLKRIGIDLNMEWKENIQSIGEIRAYLCSSLEANSKLSDTLFIFDDIWEKDHYKYLSFAKKSICTSRFEDRAKERGDGLIRLPKKLEYKEAIELLALLAVNDNARTLLKSSVVEKVIDSCQGLPLAIAIIGRLGLETEKEWNRAKGIIAKKSADIELAHYGFNLYGTLQLSVDSLENENKQLFEQLAVFKRVSIPIQSVASLWNYDVIEARPLVKKMHNKSLLTYDEEK
ncbi:uncharacterized protein TRIADDRAFT_62501 [Trichoplax adhaerens]|uniref:NB-ARC domain-containing protein n=1 Tax=Trichoplax adhaerens TaxID=10228 RepID=B3SDZ8_TRIAD|nr:hypothetical protein TRIADDRAFT_62501 [Trichoplax adhaerens]EDV19046.1 hypothetical protein TRIADDRAFT_62501 [Trichoplax adhaerens]|eukprot:XP_002118467.1 hypothetical protein TRIADDRAFT_62501 [Trichoplax adhaerens]